ncbi:MAG: hypothetical protein CSA95_05185 [Bacteroidetes bacterium]|nr:MAG: hypothetical protein CSA95_05185 [Bacteroidota bacterium]
MGRYAFVYIAIMVSVLTLIPIIGTHNQQTHHLREERLSEEELQAITQIFHQEDIALIDSVMRIYRRSYRFNGAVMIAERGRMLYNKTFGYGDIGEKERLTTAHSFQLASVSKQFTAAAIMILAERKELNISDSVITFFPDFPYPNVTIEHLLHHTSGLPNYMWMYENRWEETTLAPHNDTLMAMLANNRLGRYFRPGRKHDYSNTGYAVLACIVAKVSGKSFEDFLQDEIFTPLEMKHSFAWAQGHDTLSPGKTIPGYYRRGRRFYRVNPSLHDGILGDKGVWSNGEDLFKWDEALNHGTLISDSMLQIAFTPFKLHGRWEVPYGYGFRIKKINGKKTVYHNGLWEGFRLNFYRYVEDQRTVFVMDHTNLTITGIMARRFRRLLERTKDNHETQLLVETALSNSPETAIKLYFLLRHENPDLLINRKKIHEVARYFSDQNCIPKANALKELLDFFDQEITASSPEEGPQILHPKNNLFHHTL